MSTLSAYPNADRVEKYDWKPIHPRNATPMNIRLKTGLTKDNMMETKTLTVSQMNVKRPDFLYDSSSATNLARPSNERKAVTKKNVGHNPPAMRATAPTPGNPENIIARFSQIIIVKAPTKNTSVSHFILFEAKNNFRPSMKLVRIGISTSHSSNRYHLYRINPYLDVST
jgi:hypothetical protein